MSFFDDPLRSIGNTMQRGGSEAVSFLNSGKTLTAKENEAAVKVQARWRGSQTRMEMEHLKEEEPEKP